MDYSTIKKLLPANKRSLTQDEIDTLIENRNHAQSWDLIHVSKSFDPSSIKNCSFYGIVYLGNFNSLPIHYNGVQLFPGITNSSIQNSIIYDNCIIHNCGLCANYIIENQTVILNVSEISSSESASFGEGFSLNNPDFVHSIALINENGGRSILPFSGFNCADAWMIIKNNHNPLFKDRIEKIIKQSVLKKSNQLGKIGEKSRILNTTAIRNCIIYEFSVIDGARYLENSTILSAFDESTNIKSGVEVSNSIIGYGNNLQSSCLLIACITGTAVSVSQSARITESFIGDNSAISCCEIAHSLIFPFHNQHHNNSFLIASCIGGQSNLAAGATVGSNHNSRANDGELWASRGFWPGLCTSFKHNSRFASFTTCVKADYPSELNLPYPFSLISNDPSSNVLTIYPAWAISSNLYSLIRSSQKFLKRDKRVHKEQIIEHSPFAPDTVEESFNALSLIELNVGAQWYKENGTRSIIKEDLIYKGREILNAEKFNQPVDLEPFTVEKSRRKITLIKPGTAWKSYRLIIEWFSVSTIALYDIDRVLLMLEADFSDEDTEWVNAGGQIVRKIDASNIINRIIDDKSISFWEQIHTLFSDAHSMYHDYLLKYAIHALFRIQNSEFRKDRKTLAQLIEKSVKSIDSIYSLTIESRQKDFQDPFRLMVYDSFEESQYVLGTIQNDFVINSFETETIHIKNNLDELIKNLKNQPYIT
jgi:NDP-sugar pyrophosphorylase family protein